MCPSGLLLECVSLILIFYYQRFSTVKASSVVSAQIFDQHKFKRRDQGFLGFVNIQVADYLDLELGGHSTFSSVGVAPPPFATH